MAKRFNNHDLASVQDFAAGRLEVGFKTKVAVERFLIDSVTRMKDLELKFKYPGLRPMVACVLGYAADKSMIQLIAELSWGSDQYLCSTLFGATLPTQ